MRTCLAVKTNKRRLAKRDLGNDMIRQNENHNKVGKIESYAEVQPVTGLMSESLISTIWRNRRIVLLMTILVLAAVILYLTNTTPSYTSTSKIYVEQSGPKIVTEVEDGIMTRSKNYLYTQAELLRSETRRYQRNISRVVISQRTYNTGAPEKTGHTDLRRG